MVVNHIQQNSQTLLMAGIHQCFQIVGCSITMMGRVEIHAVITPSPRARELVDWQQLEMRDAQIRQIVKPLHGRAKGPGRSEGSNVQFIDHCTSEAGLAQLISPVKGAE